MNKYGSISSWILKMNVFLATSDDFGGCVAVKNSFPWKKMKESYYQLFSSSFVSVDTVVVDTVVVGTVAACYSLISLSVYTLINWYFKTHWIKFWIYFLFFC